MPLLATRHFSSMLLYVIFFLFIKPSYFIVKAARPHFISTFTGCSNAMLTLHRWKLLILTLVANTILCINLALGDIKSWNDIRWLDVISEGSTALLALVWLLLILRSRPKGRVTHWLSAGLSCIFLAGFQDWLDEFVAFAETAVLDHWIESGLMPIGLGLLTLGIYHWHQEQLAINEQLRKRERLFREHRDLDFVTQLQGANYLRKILQQELIRHQASQSSLALILIDVDFFDAINRRYSRDDGDRLLQAIGELILLNIRRNDLLCRYAGDRYAVVLPNTGYGNAEKIAIEISQAIRHLAFKTYSQHESVFHSASWGISISNPDNRNAMSAEEIIQSATRSLLRAKEKRQSSLGQAA